MTICRCQQDLFLNCSRDKNYLNNFPKIIVAIKGNKYNKKIAFEISFEVYYGWILNRWASSKLIIGQEEMHGKHLVTHSVNPALHVSSTEAGPMSIQPALGVARNEMFLVHLATLVKCFLKSLRKT